MTILPVRRRPVESTPVVVATRVYADLPGTTLILDVPIGADLEIYAAQARSVGGTRVRAHQLGADGMTIRRLHLRPETTITTTNQT